MSANTLTLDKYLVELKDTVVATGPAQYVHNRSKSGKKIDVPGVAETLLESGNTIFVCQDDMFVFPTAASAKMHRSRMHIESASEDTETPQSKARRRTQSNARTDLAEPTYGELKKKYDAALTRIGELDRELKLSDKENKGLELAAVALRGKVEDLEKGIVDHSNCYEFVGKGRGNEGKEVDIVRKDGFVFRAYPV